MTIVSLTGLLIIGIGTGGIKPCVSAFGGDQFKEEQKEELQKFFSIFYLSINLGSLLSTFITPILREDVHCFGERTCFALAFGVPAILMIVALLLYICGKPLYTIRPPEGNIIVEVTKCICYAIGRKYSSDEKKSHWLDYADDKFDEKLIGDIKILLKVLVLYIPLPLFWALFDQQGSRWILQATRMDGKLNGFHLKADQMQVLNPLLIIIFIPLFNYVVYPLLSKCHLLKTSLQRIATGGSLAAVSFVIAGLLELNLEGAYPRLPDSGNSQITIINNSPCNIKIDGVNIPSIAEFKTAVAPEIPLGNFSEWKFNPENCAVTKSYDFSFYSNTSIESMMISLVNDSLTVIKSNDTKTKSKDGEPQVRVFYNIDLYKEGNVSFLLKREDGLDYYIYAATPDEIGVTGYGKFPPGRYKMYLPYNETAYEKIPVIEEEFKSGGIYITYIYNKPGEQKKTSSTYVMVQGNTVTILLQIPQYILITAGEIMFSITGLKFSYSQAPNSMKSVLQAAWLLTTAFGNLIVLLIAKMELFEKTSYELFLFALLMFIDMAVFATLAYFYKYVTIKTPSAEELELAASREKNNESQRTSNESQGRSNEADNEN